MCLLDPMIETTHLEDLGIMDTREEELAITNEEEIRRRIQSDCNCTNAPIGW